METFKNKHISRVFKLVFRLLARVMCMCAELYSPQQPWPKVSKEQPSPIQSYSSAEIIVAGPSLGHFTFKI